MHGAARMIEQSPTQLRKLRRLLLDAWQFVPMYRRLYEAGGLRRGDLADPGVLERLPVLGKQQLLATPPEDRRDRRFDSSRLIAETTTGSTGQPFTLYIDRRYRALRNLRFLRGLAAAGYRPWHKLLLLTDRHRGLSRRHRWYYQSVECPAAEIRQSLLTVSPDVLYGFTTPLRLLAEDLLRDPAPNIRLKFVISTAEMLDAFTRRILEAAFGCPVFDFYGMTEMGLVAWQRPSRYGYIMSRSSVLTEFIADAACHGRYRMVMTNMDLRASPLIRFDSGDLAQVETVSGKRVVTAFEGRSIDTLVCRDGSELSPYRVTDALRDVPGVRRFKITQHDLADLEVDLEADCAVERQVEAETSRILEGLLGSGLKIEFRFNSEIVPEGSRKFRPVESRIGRT